MDEEKVNLLSDAASGDVPQTPEVGKKRPIEYLFPEWYTAKHEAVYRKKLKVIKHKRDLHLKSAKHYERFDLYLVSPSVVISATSGVLSFLSTSTMVSDDMQNAFGLIVGCMASVTTMLQSVSGACQFGVKAEAHRTAAEEYDKLSTRVQFESEMPNEEDFFDQLEERILSIQEKCKFFPPDNLCKDYRNYMTELESETPDLPVHLRVQ